MVASLSSMWFMMGVSCLRICPLMNCTPHCAASLYLCKCFTYVTKTFANLTTYSRKPENYNGTIIFEIDIMKNSSPINSNLYQTWLFHNFFLLFLLFWFTLEFDIMKNSSPINLNLCQTWLFHLFILFWFTLNWAESAVSPAEKRCYFGLTQQKM